jgi:hypothetical protein
MLIDYVLQGSGRYVSRSRGLSGLSGAAIT